MKIFVLGPAGCGKSSFVKYFSRYLSELDLDVRCVNLDPASNPIYDADKDIRDFVRTEQIMKIHRLGINGALLKSMDESLRYVEKVRIEGDYVLIDTPGQMEVFIYSKSGREIIDRLAGRNSIGLFLIDSSLIDDPESFLSVILQNVVVSLRLSIATATILTKSDIKDIDVEGMRRSIVERKDTLAELLERTSDFIEYTTLSQRIVKVSNPKMEGYHDVYSLVNEMFCTCGDVS